MMSKQNKIKQKKKKQFLFQSGNWGSQNKVFFSKKFFCSFFLRSRAMVCITLTLIHQNSRKDRCAILRRCYPKTCTFLFIITHLSFAKIEIWQWWGAWAGHVTADRGSEATTDVRQIREREKRVRLGQCWPRFPANGVQHTGERTGSDPKRGPSTSERNRKKRRTYQEQW